MDGNSPFACGSNEPQSPPCRAKCVVQLRGQDGVPGLAVARVEAPRHDQPAVHLCGLPERVHLIEPAAGVVDPKCDNQPNPNRRTRVKSEKCTCTVATVTFFPATSSTARCPVAPSPAVAGSSRIAAQQPDAAHARRWTQDWREGVRWIALHGLPTGGTSSEAPPTCSARIASISFSRFELTTLVEATPLQYPGGVSPARDIARPKHHEKDDAATS